MVAILNLENGASALKAVDLEVNSVQEHVLVPNLKMGEKDVMCLEKQRKHKHVTKTIVQVRFGFIQVEKSIYIIFPTNMTKIHKYVVSPN